MRNDARVFGKNVRRLRIQAGLSQREVAEALQKKNVPLTRGAYSQIECGFINIRDIELKALKEVFDVEYDAFFENCGGPDEDGFEE